MFDPIADSEEVKPKTISPRVEDLSNKRIGLFDNGKRTAKPTLQVVEERLKDNYNDVTVNYYSVEHMNVLKNEDELAQIREWANEETDVCIGAIGDCGSCTKYLVYGVNAIEESGTPAVGLIDEGFGLDWQTNSSDFGRKLRYYKLPPIAEVTDIERIRRSITTDTMCEIADELARTSTDNESAQRSQTSERADEAATKGE